MSRFQSRVPSYCPPVIISWGSMSVPLLELAPGVSDEVGQRVVGGQPVAFFGGGQGVVAHGGVELVSEAGGVFPELG